MESSRFWPLVLHDPLYKTLFFDFSFRLSNAQNLLPLICKKTAYKSACMADRPEMFGPTRGFSGMADSMEACKMLWADPCCHGNEIWARRGDPVAYRLVIIIIIIINNIIIFVVITVVTSFLMRKLQYSEIIVYTVMISLQRRVVVC